MREEIHQLPEEMADKYMEETEPCPYYEEVEIARRVICEECLYKNSLRGGK